jgi:hypothetical protein
MGNSSQQVSYCMQVDNDIFSIYTDCIEIYKEGLPMKLKKEFERLKYQLGFLKRTDCSANDTKKYIEMLNQGMPLPDGVFRDDPDCRNEFATFYTVEKTELSKEEISEYIQYKQLCTLITIKKCVVYFTVLSIISLVAGLISVFMLLA